MNEANDSKFATRKWNIFNDNSKTNYKAANEITYNTEILNSSLCNYMLTCNDAYILVTGDITVPAAPEAQVLSESCTPFTKCITKIDRTTIDDAENLDLVMPIYNLIEHSSDSSKTTGSLWFYSKNEAPDFNAVIANDNKFESSKYKANLLENTLVQPTPNTAGILKNATISMPLKYLTNF